MIPQQAQYGQWDVLDDATGQSLVSFTAFLDLDYKGESKALTQPTEEGGFCSYNKVQSPRDIYVTLALTGDDTALTEAQEALDRAQNDVTLLSVLTPTGVLSSMTLVGFCYRRRREDGINMLLAELQLQEVRQVAAQYAGIALKQAKNPADASTQDRGKVQSTSWLKQIF